MIPRHEVCRGLAKIRRRGCELKNIRREEKMTDSSMQENGKGHTSSQIKMPPSAFINYNKETGNSGGAYFYRKLQTNETCFTDYSLLISYEKKDIIVPLGTSI